MSVSWFTFYILFLNLKLEKVRMKEKKEKKGWEITRSFSVIRRNVSSSSRSCPLSASSSSFTCFVDFRHLFRLLLLHLLYQAANNHIPVVFVSSPPICSNPLFFPSLVTLPPASPPSPSLPLSFTYERISGRERNELAFSDLCYGCQEVPKPCTNRRLKKKKQKKSKKSREREREREREKKQEINKRD